MAGGKETPRQKMIGMMYLFLTALLALNVSKEIINAFVVINKGLEETNSNYAAKLKSQYAGFEKAYNDNPVKAKIYWDQAQKIRTEAQLLTKYLTEVKGRIVASSEDNDQTQFAKYIGKDKNGQDTLVNLNILDKKDDYDSPTNLLIGGEPSSPKKDPYSAHDMVTRVQKFRDLIKGACKNNPAMVKRFDELFAFKDVINPDGKPEAWGVLNFYHSPVVASIAVISKLQADVKNAESEAIAYLMEAIGAEDIRFTKILPVVQVKSSYVALGDSLVAQISLGAIDETKAPTIIVNGQSIPVRNGSGYLSARPTTPGDQVWKGMIRFDGGTGMTELPFEIPFKVATSTDAVIDPTAMNVLYVGLDNPIDVAVPGADKDLLQVSCNSSKVSVRKEANGKYMFKPTGTFASNETVEVSVSGKTSTGGSKNFGVKKFRIKNVPAPMPIIGGKTTSDNSISLLQLQSAGKVSAVLKDFVFDGVTYKVTKFTMSVQSAGGLRDFESSSEALTPDMKQAIGGLRKNMFVLFSNIYAVGPDQKPKALSNLSFKIN